VEVVESPNSWERLNLTYSVELNKKSWIMDVGSLAEEGMTTHLHPLGTPFISGDILMLDWHDTVKNPKSARLHIRVKENPKATVGENRKKIQSIIEGLLVYDSLMVNADQIRDLKDMEMLLKDHKLPRVETAVLDTGHEVWRKRFENMGFPVDARPPHPIYAPWNKLITAAKSGRLV
jgi:hypothetical protein